MSFLEKLDVVFLDNNKSFVVTEINKTNNDEYLMLVGIDEDDELTDEIRYGKVVTMPDRKFGIQTIRDEYMVKE